MRRWIRGLRNTTGCFEGVRGEGGMNVEVNDFGRERRFTFWS